MNNVRNTITDQKSITWEYWARVLFEIMRLDIINISVTFRHPHTKDIITVKSTDTFAIQQKEHEKDKQKDNVIT